MGRARQECRTRIAAARFGERASPRRCRSLHDRGQCHCSMGLPGCGVPVVISERNQPDRPGLGSLHKLVRRVSYTSARALVVQTEDIATWARRRFRIPIHIIPNPVKLQPARASAQRRRRSLPCVPRASRSSKGIRYSDQKLRGSGRPASRLAAYYLRGRA